MTHTATSSRNQEYTALESRTVTPPPGYLAVPPELSAPEDGGGRIDIVMEAVS